MGEIINNVSDSRSGDAGQPDDGLSCLNPSAEIVRRGQEALARQRRAFDDWMDVAEALDHGRAEVMREVGTNQPTGRRFERAMAEWLRANSFHTIDKGTRNRLLECLHHRKEIEAWRARLTEPERFKYNHPDSVLRRWKAATVIPDPNAPPKTSPFAKQKAALIEVQEELYRHKREIERGGGDLWTPQDTADDIATVVLGRLPANKAERVARAILKKLKDNQAGAKARQATATAAQAAE